MKHRLSDGSGFLEIDHSNSPGMTQADVAHLPESMRRQMLIVSEGKVEARDVQQCSHCQRTVVLNPKRTEADRDTCLRCYSYICKDCARMLAATGVCVPFKQVLDRAGDIAEKYSGQLDHPELNALNDVAELSKPSAPRIVLTDAL